MSEQEQFEREQMQNEQSEQLEQSGQAEQPEQPEQVDATEPADNGIYATPDVYQTQTAQEIYRTPDMSERHHNTGGVFSGEQPMYGNDDHMQNVQNPYGGQYGDNQPGSSNNAADAYRDGYGNVQPENVPYENTVYGNERFGNNAYGSNQYGNDQYGNSQPEGNTYGKNQNGGNQYGGGQYGNNRYGNPYGNPYNPDSYGYNPYSPYAVPPQKKNTGLIIGVIIGVAVLFLIAILALFYHAIENLVVKKDEPNYRVQVEEYTHDNDEYDSNNDRTHTPDYNYGDDDDDYDYDNDRGHSNNNYDNDYYNAYDDDEYYTLHDDIKDLSYSIDWEYFEYDAGGENVIIEVEYPVIIGGRIPNKEMINDELEAEIGFFTDYYEEEYSKYMNDDDSYFYVSATAYVTYMSEDILSVVFSEAVYSDYFDSISLYCLNFDMQNGVILDNTDILSVDDEFSIDFRYRSERQNGTIDELDYYSDQEITQMLTSSGSLIIFYTPQGLEVGVNYDEGYVTVTYHDYKDYLNTF